MPSREELIDAINYKRLFENSQDGIYFSTLDGEILNVNQAFLDTTGYSKEDIYQIKTLDLYVNLKRRAKFQKKIKENLSVKDFEIQLYKKDKSIMTCHLTSSVFKNGKDEVVGYKGVIRDITILKAAESALKTSERRFRELFHGSPDSILVEDLNGIILDANPAACDMYNMLYTELVGRNAFDLIPLEHVKYVKEKFSDRFEKGSNTFESFVFSSDKKTILPIEISINRIKYVDKQAILLHVRDITKRITTENELIKERRNRLFEITDAQELEKKRIAKDLHDGIGQMLFGTKMKLDALKRKIRKGTDQKACFMTVEDIEQDLQAIITEARELSHRLRPSVLDDFGLASAFNQLFDQFTKGTDLQINFKMLELEERINPIIETSLYRITQESIKNAVTHGKASKIWCFLSKRDEGIELLIRDNGIGIKNVKQNYEGHGLKNMKERSEMLNGTFEISSFGGKEGTLIKVFIPINQINDTQNE